MTHAVAGIHLLTSSIEKVRAFYHQLFGWDIRHAPHTGGYEIHWTEEVTPVGSITQVPFVGMPSFWMIYISVSALEAVLEKVTP